MDPKGMTELSLDAFSSLDLGSARRLIPSWLGAFVAGTPEQKAASESVAAAVLQELSDSQIAEALQRLATSGSHYGFFAADPAIRHLIRAYMGSITVSSPVSGLANQRAAMDQGPVL